MADLDINKVAIIGGGPAGICAAKHLHHNKFNGKRFEIVVFEKQDQVGGIWIYNKWDKSKQENEISPIYKDLRANGPKQIHHFPDYPLPDQVPHFPIHTVILEYLQNYAKHFDIEQFIKFNTEVTMVTPLIHEDVVVSEDENDRFIKWKVQSKNIQSNEEYSEEFDAVIVCNGLQWTPNIPWINGIVNFKGKILHSKYYDDPSEFQDKVVVIYGFGITTIDIVPVICKTAAQIYISSYAEPIFKGNHPSNVKCVGDIIKVNENGDIEFAGDISVKADVLIYCTGYLNAYPSLSPQCKVEVTENGKLVSPIYKHLFHAIYPSLIIGSLAYHLPSFPFMHQQCAFIAAILSGSKKLPSQQGMLDDIEKQKAKVIASGKPLNKFHTIGFDCGELADNYSDLSGENKNPASVFDSFSKTLMLGGANFYNYKEEFVRRYKNEYP